MNDDFLTKFRKSPPPEFAAALYQRISKLMPAQPKTIALPTAVLTFSIFAVLALTLLISPSIHAFAEGLVQQIGGYIFVQGTPPPGQLNLKDKVVGTPSAADLARMTAKQTPVALQQQNPSEYSTELAQNVQKKSLAGAQQIWTVDEASAQAGFTVCRQLTSRWVIHRARLAGRSQMIRAALPFMPRFIWPVRVKLCCRSVSSSLRRVIKAQLIPAPKSWM